MSRRLAIASMLLGMGAAAHATDTYDLASQQLTIPSIQVGQTLYTSVVVHIALSQVLQVGGGNPSAGTDTYVNGILTMPDVIASNGRTYTNVTARVALTDVVSIGGRTPVDLASAPGDAALEAYLQASHQYSLNATDGLGNTWTIGITNQAIATPTTFNGVAQAYRTLDTVDLYRNGVLEGSDVSTSYFQLHPYVALGKVDSKGSPYALATTVSGLPATLTVGSSGLVNNLTYYHNSARSVVDAHEANSYVVEANDQATVSLCLISVISGTTASGTSDGLANGTETDCYTVSAAGTVDLVSIHLVASGVDLTFR